MPSQRSDGSFRNDFPSPNPLPKAVAGYSFTALSHKGEGLSL